MHPTPKRCALVLAAVLALPAGAGAQEPAPCCGALPDELAPLATQLPFPEFLPGSPAPRTDGEFGAAAADDLLDGARGGSDLANIDTRLTGTVSGNTTSNVATGSNIIQGGSFAHMAGIPIVVQNTGANVLIQNATVINLQLQ